VAVHDPDPAPRRDARRRRADGTPIDVVLADVPGLIEGAARARGSGSGSCATSSAAWCCCTCSTRCPFEPDRDPVRDLAVLRASCAHDPSLLERPQLVVLNKVDLPDGQAMAELVRASSRRAGEEVLEVSAVTGAGLDALRYRLGELVAPRSASASGSDRVEAPATRRSAPLAPRGPTSRSSATRTARSS
jgi:GTPase